MTIRINNSIATFLRTQLGWDKLTEIQEKTIPAILDGNSVLIVSGTATGKTEAAMIPILNKLLQSSCSGLNCVYFAPLKALINDLFLRIKELFDPFGIHVQRWHGDVSVSDKSEAIRRARILIITPESMESLLSSKKIPSDLFSNLQYVVIDEIHSFLAGPRGSQVLSLIERLQLRSEKRLQKIAMSATVGNPEDLIKWIKGSSKIPHLVLEDETYSNREIRALMQEQASIEELLAKLQEFGNLKTLVFAGSRNGVEKCVKSLEKCGIEAYPHHSSISKDIRQNTEKSFKESLKRQVVVSTSTLELGIDIGDIDSALFLDVPYSLSSLLQSIGRTGRKSKKLNAWIIVNNEAGMLRLLGLMKMLEFNNIEKLRSLDYYPQLLGHQLVSLSYEYGVINRDVLAQVKLAHPFEKIKQRDFISIVDHLCENGFLVKRPGGLLEPGPETFEIMEKGKNKMNFVVLFPGSADFTVTYKGLEVGTLQPIFVQYLFEALETTNSASFTLARESWLVQRIDEKKRRVYVVPGTDETIPKWMSAGPRIELELAQAVRLTLLEEKIPDSIELSRILKRRLNDVLIAGRETVSRTEFVSARIETGDLANMIFYSYLGDIGNLFLSELFSVIGERTSSRNWRSVTIKTKQRIGPISQDLLRLLELPREQLIHNLAKSIDRDSRKARLLYLQLGDTLQRFAGNSQRVRSLAEYLADERFIKTIIDGMRAFSSVGQRAEEQRDL